MPTYDYECDECGYEMEAFHGMFAEPLMDCPKCKQSKLIKLIGAGAAVIVKGTENPCTGTGGGRIEKKKPKKKFDRLGEGKNKNGDPWWRSGPVNKNVLKNPKKYIEKGKVE